MARTEQQALLAVKAAKWVSFLYFLALWVAGGFGVDVHGLIFGVLLFWTLLAFAMQDRIEKGGVTTEHPGVALVQATIWPGLPRVADVSPPLLAGHVAVALSFVVAAVFLQRALYHARPDERTVAVRRAHRRLGIGLAVITLVLFVAALPRAPEDSGFGLYALPLLFAFFGWAAGLGFYIGVARVVLFLAAAALAIGTLVAMLRWHAAPVAAVVVLLIGVVLSALACRAVPR